jgi:hypothetical protein
MRDKPASETGRSPHLSALTVTLGAGITALKRAMAGAADLVGAFARRMGNLTSAGLAGLGKGGEFSP